MPERYLNPDDFYANELDKWSLFWVEDDSIFRNIQRLVATSVFLPQPHLLNPIVATYILMPSKWARVAGILFSFGDQGSGKSVIATLANLVHGIRHTFSPTDTFASIRNSLDTMRWIDPVDKNFEKEGSILCWDNIHIQTLKEDKRIYQLLLFGYNRSTDKIQIAGADGTNKQFHVFSPKIISSIEPIHLHHEFAELRRRLIVVPHKKWEKFTSEERSHYEGLDINVDRLDLDSISWKGIESRYYTFWNDENNCRLYAGYRAMLTRKGKKGFSIPKVIDGEKWSITIDLIATGLVVGTWSDVQAAVDFMAEYWTYSNTFIYGEFNATMEHLRAFVESETSTIRELNNKLAEAGQRTHSIIVSSRKVKDRLSYLQSEGSLDITPTTRDITNLMWQLGYKLTTKGWTER